MSENPCASVDTPKVDYDPENIHIYDEETLGQFLNALETDQKVKTKYKVLVYLALITGMRRGEILALEWSAIDFERGQIYVRQASEYIVGQPLTTKDPKTKGSKRKLSISDDIIDLLDLLKEEQIQQQNKKGERWVSSDRVFTNNSGGFMHVNTFHNWLQKFTSANNFPPISPHDFRHMSATYKLQEGAGLKAVQGDLGHTRVGTTNRYTHRLEWPPVMLRIECPLLSRG
ncbi:Tyrosine recombinase XerD [Sporomusa ovata DSM 2662]|nr:site-specific integrase [Sporomusa ovata]EQB27630.1 integrase family protein [Sporomusa ovata DSM 2662]